jgi:hypothetical protein
MSHEGDAISFARPGLVDEALAYAHADVIHAALGRVADIEASMPPALLRPFKGGEVDTAKHRIGNTRKKAGREFDDIEAVVGANRQQAQVLAYLFDYSPSGEYDPFVVAQALGDLDFRGETASWDIQQMIGGAYHSEQTAEPQVVTFDIFNSLSAEPQPPGKAVRRALDILGFNAPINLDPQFRANKRRDSSGNARTHATVFPKIETGDGLVDQDQRFLTAYYSQQDPDVSISVTVSVKAVDSPPATR